MIIDGRFIGVDGGYDSHGAELLVELTNPEVAEDMSFTVLLTAEVNDAGQFRFDVPDGDVVRAELTARNPAGDLLARDQVELAAGQLELPVKPTLPVPVDILPNPLSPSKGPFGVRVVVVDVTANQPASNRLVSIYGRPVDDGTDSLVPKTPIIVLAADYTDEAGAVSLEIARAPYAGLDVRVSGTIDGDLVQILPIDADGVPQATIRAFANFPDEDPGSADGTSGEQTGGTDDDCECETPITPRTPTQEDLIDSEGVYATDLADGSCPSPAVANRTMEEYRFYSLIRTTDPFLKGVKPKPPRPISDLAIEALTELSYGFGGMDSTLAASSDNDGRGTISASRAAEPTLDQVRQRSDTYYTSGLIGAQAWSRLSANENIREEILNRAGDLSEDALRYALADPDGFTPVSLMTAERASALDNLHDRLRLFHDASKGRELVSSQNMPRWDEASGSYQAATIAHGHVLEWRQAWRADGYSLGDLLYSLPLAPGQKRKVAVVDWDRGERSFRFETRSATEDFSADLIRNRLVTEVVNSTVTESIDAGSSANTWAAGGGLGLGIPFSGGFFGLGVAGGGGGSSSDAWQNSARSLAATSGQQLSDRTNQASSAVRSQRATVVVGEQQSEGVAITSEVVANYNHCHAMTMEYFEVLQHFRVDQELASVRECLFIPLTIRPFHVWKALQWRDILQPRLRRRKWFGGFDAMERILRGYADSNFPLERFADEPITELSGEMRFELSIARPREIREEEPIDEYLDKAWDFWTDLFGTSSTEKVYDTTIEDRELADEMFADQYAPRVARAFCDSLTVTLVVEDPASGATRDEKLECDMTMVSPYRPGGLHLVSFRATSVPADVTRAMILAVRIESELEGLSPNSTTVLRMANMHYANEHRRHRLVPGKWMRNDVFAGDGALISTRSLTRSEERNPRQEDQELHLGLLQHLNEFLEHYHQIIWWRMDPNRRFMLLDGFIAPRTGGRSLASVVENRLLSIVGNCLVMPVAPGYQLDPLVTGIDGEAVDLLEAYRPPIPFVPKRISLPTRGVHAEAILGECNSCEVRDDTRFWDWTSEPIPNNDPTEIAEISTASRRQEPDDTTPTDLPGPVVAIQNAPAAPDPVSIGALANLLSQPDLFKDVTGLEQNQLNAQAAFEQALKTANAFGKMAASGAKASFANRSGERVMRKVQEAEESGLLQSDDAADVVGKLLGVMNGDPTDSDVPLTQEPVVKRALDSVNASNGEKSVSVTASSGSTQQTVETHSSTPTSIAAPPTDFIIDGVVPLKQPSPLSCWAVSLTMLVSHQRQQSLPVEVALSIGGEPYIQRYRDDSGLPIDEVETFRVAFDLTDVSFGALTAAAIESTLQAHGPLWVIADEDSTPAFSIHARVITGIQGDGTPTGSTIIYNDPSAGREERESLKSFGEKLDQLSEGVTSAFGGVSPTVLAL